MDTFNTQGKSTPESISTAGYKLAAPNLIMRVEDHGRDGRIVRSDGDDLPMAALAAACESNGARLMREFKIDLEGATGGAAVKRSDGELEMKQAAPLQLVTPAKEQLQTAVLHQDERGELRWILPERETEAGEEVFNLPPVAAGPAHRGPVTKKIRRIVKVIAWLAADTVGHLALNLVTNWEKKNRPYGLLGYDNQQLTGTPNWDRLKSGKKSLLFLHGTFSTGPAAFAGLLTNTDNMKSLEQAYEGRIFAFNHPSLSANPTGNIQELHALLPPEMKGASVDIITHSRGGLVGRELMAQTQAGTGPGLKVDKAILVAGPHQGTILTNEKHWVSMIDTYTNLLLQLPDNVVTIVLEGLISLIKIIGANAVKGLPGLQAMLPDGEYLNKLKAQSLGEANVHTMGARFLPMGDNLLGMAKAIALKVVLKKIFGEDSDMVVPTDGSLSIDGVQVPDSQQVLYDTDSAINHINFFNNQRVNRQLVDWLTANK